MMCNLLILMVPIIGTNNINQHIVFNGFINIDK